MADKKQDLHELFRDALKNEDPNETYRIYTMTSLNYETFKTDEWNRKEQGQPTVRTYEACKFVLRRFLFSWSYRRAKIETIIFENLSNNFQ